MVGKNSARGNCAAGHCQLDVGDNAQLVEICLRWQSLVVCARLRRSSTRQSVRSAPQWSDRTTTYAKNVKQRPRASSRLSAENAPNRSRAQLPAPLFARTALIARFILTLLSRRIAVAESFARSFMILSTGARSISVIW